MRDITKLHPTLQKKAEELIALCKSNGISIKISECVRTVEEQDALYAKGRTAPGNKVTNAKGSSYSSMHQWGVAFDFYLDMDIDGDGAKSDDAYNNVTGLFDKVGRLGQSIGLEWGGAWKSIKDRPHFQLPDWGSTTTKLKNVYGTPNNFMATWSKSTAPAPEPQPQPAPQKKVEDYSKNEVDSARVFDKKLAKSYTTTANLYLRKGAGTAKGIINLMPKGSKVTNYGYYTDVNGTKWLLVTYGKYTGYCSKKYLK